MSGSQNRTTRSPRLLLCMDWLCCSPHQDESYFEKLNNKPSLKSKTKGIEKLILDDYQEELVCDLLVNADVMYHKGQRMQQFGTIVFYLATVCGAVVPVLAGLARDENANGIRFTTIGLSIAALMLNLVGQIFKFRDRGIRVMECTTAVFEQYDYFRARARPLYNSGVPHKDPANYGPFFESAVLSLHRATKALHEGLSSSDYAERSPPTGSEDSKDSHRATKAFHVSSSDYAKRSSPTGSEDLKVSKMSNPGASDDDGDGDVAVIVHD